MEMDNAILFNNIISYSLNTYWRIEALLKDIECLREEFSSYKFSLISRNYNKAAG